MGKADARNGYRANDSTEWSRLTFRCDRPLVGSGTRLPVTFTSAVKGGGNERNKDNGCYQKNLFPCVEWDKHRWEQVTGIGNGDVGCHGLNRRKGAGIASSP